MEHRSIEFWLPPINNVVSNVGGVPKLLAEKKDAVDLGSDALVTSKRRSKNGVAI
jgi:hypothetical protein